MQKVDSLAVPKAKGKLSAKKLRFLIGGLLIVGVIGYLVYSALPGSMLYYVTPSELKARGTAIYGEQIRLGGRVGEGSVQWDNRNLILKFDIADDVEALPVVYKGVVPDAFKPGGDVVVEGKYSGTGVFEATNLLAKCPSKFEPSS